MYNSIIIILTNIMKSSKLSNLKMREARFWPKMKFEPIFLQVLWQFFNPKGSLPQGGRKGGLGGIPPAPLQILGEICSNFFERTPPFRKLGGIGENSPADFPFKLDFFIFAPLLWGRPKAGFPNFHF